MILNLNISLPISPENEGLIGMVASHNGWTATRLFKTGVDENGADVLGAITAQAFITDHMLEPYLALYVEEKVGDAFTWFYGVSGAANKVALITLLKSQLTITAEFQ